MAVFVIPISNDGESMRSIEIAMPTPLTGEEWEQLHAVLEAMRPGLVRLDEPTTDSPE